MEGTTRDPSALDRIRSNVAPGNCIFCARVDLKSLPCILSGSSGYSFVPTVVASTRIRVEKQSRRHKHSYHWIYDEEEEEEYDRVTTNIYRYLFSRPSNTLHYLLLASSLRQTFLSILFLVFQMVLVQPVKRAMM
jgi:hypothetical protein